MEDFFKIKAAKPEEVNSDDEEVDQNHIEESAGNE